MPEVSLKLIPGVNVEATETLNQSGVSSCQLIRYKSKLPQKIGGWQKFYQLSINGIPRAMAAWQDLSVVDHLAVGTTTTLGVITDQTFSDITPQTKTTDFSPNFSTSSGSAVVVIVDSNISNVTTYDTVFFNTPIAVGGLILQGAYAITTIGGTHTYNIAASSNASSMVSNGGAVPTFTASSGSSIITVNLTAHGLSVGSFFTFPIPTTASGVIVSGTYRVLSVPDPNSFTIAVSSLATGSATTSMNGGNAEIIYYLNIGPAAAGTGFGVGGFGVGAFGSGVVPVSQTGTPITATDWTISNWGEILLACPEGGGIYQWAPNTGFQNAGLISTAPIFNAGIFVAMPAQILVAYGSTAAAPGSLGTDSSAEQQDPLIVRWSDLLDYSNWSVTSLTQAGSFHIPEGSKIIGGLQGPQQALIWTDLAVWAMSYMGPPLVYGFNKISDGCGLIGKHAAAVIRGGVYWMGTGSFFVLSGNGVQSLPCSVWDIVYQDIDTTNQSKSFAAANSAFDEMWWFYPSMSGGTGECDKYVKFNLEDLTWDYGSIPRSAWIDQSVLGQPIGATPHGIIYQHESGFDADGQPLVSWFETGYFVISEGQDFAFVDWFFPDMKWGYANGVQTAIVMVTITAIDYPNGTPRVFGPFQMSDVKSFINTRLRGRQIKLKFESMDLGSWWRLGNMRYRVAIDGRR